MDSELNEPLTTKVSSAKELLEADDIVVLDVLLDELQAVILIVVTMSVDSWRA